jgi:hypothetical protein
MIDPILIPILGITFGVGVPGVALAAHFVLRPLVRDIVTAIQANKPRAAPGDVEERGCSSSRTRTIAFPAGTWGIPGSLPLNAGADPALPVEGLGPAGRTRSTSTTPFGCLGSRRMLHSSRGADRSREPGTRPPMMDVWKTSVTFPPPQASLSVYLR